MEQQTNSRSALITSSVFLLFLLFLQSAAASEVKSVKPGDDVILPCWADGGFIRAVKWTRTDLESEYVLLSRDGRSVPDDQHPSFEGRVQLVDLKKGDVSLILKQVIKSDTGTYECRVYQGSVLDTNPVRRFRLELIDSEVISVKPGDDVILSCRADDGSIRAVKWTRTDLEPEYVFFHKDGRSDPVKQHPSFKGRVQLKDSDLKDGDVSLILKNVNENDRGTYECRVERGGSGRRKRAINDSDPIRSIRLEVTDSGGDPKHFGWIAAAVVVGVVGGVGVVLVWRYKRRREQRSNPPVVDEAVNDNLI